MKLIRGICDRKFPFSSFLFYKYVDILIRPVLEDSHGIFRISYATYVDKFVGQFWRMIADS